MDEAFDDFFELVQKLWPAYRTSREAIHAGVWQWLKYEADVVVGRALHRHRGRYLVEDKPNWQMILQEIRAENEHKINDLEILLNSVRRHLAERGVKAVNDMTPADLYQNHVDANVYPITHDTRTGEAHDDTDGRRAQLAADYRRREAATWRARLLEKELPAPSFLDDG